MRLEQKVSFHEKNAWACLLSLLLVFIPYFVFVLQNPVAYLWLLVLAIVVLVGLLTTFQVINSRVSTVTTGTANPPRLDELDKVIEIRAAKVSGLVLGFGVASWCLNTMIGVLVMAKRNLSENAVTFNRPLSELTIPAETALMAIHLLFAGFVIANVVYYLAIIVGYRRAS